MRSSEIAGANRASLVLVEPPLTAPSTRLLSALYDLTAAESRVLAMLLEARRPKDIALRLSIAVSTVRTHPRSLYAKTGVRDQQTLIRLASSASTELGPGRAMTPGDRFRTNRQGA